MRATLASPETPQPIAGTSGTAVTSVAQSEEQVINSYNLHVSFFPFFLVILRRKRGETLYRYC